MTSRVLVAPISTVSLAIAHRLQVDALLIFRLTQKLAISQLAIAITFVAAIATVFASIAVPLGEWQTLLVVVTEESSAFLCS